MKEIPLTQDKTALVDDADYGWLSEFTWHAVKAWSTFYAATNVRLPSGGRIKAYMHRMILGLEGDMESDHRNHNGLDNQRFNLRPVTTSQNQMNATIRNNNTTGIKGVYFNKARKTWTAQIKVRGRHICLGCFHDIEDAIKARLVAQLSYFGEFANP
jgi:hypothetical protein